MAEERNYLTLEDASRYLLSEIETLPGLVIALPKGSTLTGEDPWIRELPTREFNMRGEQRTAAGIIYDFRNVEYVNSHAINYLLIGELLEKASRIPVSFCNLHRRVDGIFLLTKLKEVFPCYGVREEAIAIYEARAKTL